VKLAEQHKTIH